MLEIDDEDGVERIKGGRISTSMMGLLEFMYTEFWGEVIYSTTLLEKSHFEKSMSNKNVFTFKEY